MRVRVRVRARVRARARARARAYLVARDHHAVDIRVVMPERPLIRVTVRVRMSPT